MASIKRPSLSLPRRVYLQFPGSWYDAYRSSAGNSIRMGAYAFV
jgi:hypothetical protein